MTPRICIKKVKHTNMIDVFHSETGWDTGWTRFIKVLGYLKYIRGDNMSNTDLKELERITKCTC